MKRIIDACVMVAVLVVLNSCVFLPPEEETGTSAAETKNGMSLVWSDEFESGNTKTAPLNSNWVHETGAGGWGNNEVQTYTNDIANAYMSNGTLKIVASKTDGKWTSARMYTHGLHSWKYGYMEASIKLPVASGTWPAFWMMPESSVYGSWPCSGEIDIMEYAPAVSGANTVFSTLHYGTSVSTHRWTTLAKTTIASATTAFHKYAVEWNEGYIRYYYDDVAVGTQYVKGSKEWSEWPFDQKFFIIINLAMGGNLGGSISSSLSEATYEIDYVRVYQ